MAVDPDDAVASPSRRPVNAVLVGDHQGRTKLSTPALLLDLEAFEANVAAAGQLAAGAGMSLRPHVKGQKCRAMADRLIAAGVCGLSCATLAEAELMTRTAAPSVLITSPIVGAAMIDRLVVVTGGSAEVLAVVDNEGAVDALEQALARVDRSIGILVDIDVGQRRTGVPNRATLEAVARRVAAAPHLRFAGIQAYYGHLQAIRDYGERAAKARAAQEEIAACVTTLKDAGLAVAIVSGGGTGTVEIDARTGPFTELQLGSFALMDAQYLAVQITESGAPLFRPALFVRGRVVSNRQTDRVTIDIGMKAISVDGGPGIAIFPEGLHADYAFAGDEHGFLASGGKAPPLALGEAVELIPSHCDTTVNLHFAIHAVRGTALEAVWPIESRGIW